MKSILAVRDPLFLFGVVPVAKSTGKSAASGVFAEEQHSGGEDRGQCDLERLARVRGRWFARAQELQHGIFIWTLRKELYLL